MPPPHGRLLHGSIQFAMNGIKNFRGAFPIVVALTACLLLPAPAHAVLTDGANAIDLLGQYDETSFTAPVPVYTKSTANNGPNKFGFSFSIPTNNVVVDTINDRFFVGDDANNRVLVYAMNNDGTFPDRIPDNVLGQSNYYTNTAATEQNGMRVPRSLAYDSTNQRLFVSQVTSAQRVTVYDVTSITDGENATNVLGQPNFTASASAVTQNGISGAAGVAYDSVNQRLFVSQGSSVGRITIYDVSAITDGENATNVLGQPNYTASGYANTQAGMNDPGALAYDSTNSRLFVSHFGSHRVTVYDVSSITDGENATNVLGQPNYTASSSAAQQNGMNNPYGLAYDSATQRLFVAEATNNRVTLYSVSSITDGENATNVLGQPNFTISTATVTQNGMSAPRGLAYDSVNDLLFAAQTTRRGITVYSVSSITDGENAVDLLGQYDETSFTAPVPVYTKNTANNGPNKFGFSAPIGIGIDTTNHRLFAADTSNSRILVYGLTNSNILSDRVPDNILGQSNFYSGTAAVTQNGLSSPIALAYDGIGNRLFVANSNRVTVYDVASISDGENATNVLGQTNFTASTAAATQNGVGLVSGLTFDSTNSRLFVAQSTTGHRVTVYDVSSITDGENATNVLGQPNYASSATATTQNGLNSPQRLSFDSTNQRLFVSESVNNRVVLYDVTSITDGENATNVLGQPNFVSSAAAATQNGMSQVNDVVYDAVNQRLFVAQNSSANRVTIYDVSSVTNGENATNVLGQPDFISSAAASTQNGLSAPRGLAYDSGNGYLYVIQSGNSRVSIFDVALVSSDTTPPSLSSVSPTDNSTGVSTTANLVLTFDDTTRAGTGTLTIKKTSDDSIIETITVSGALLSGNGSTQLTLNPSATLSESTSYYITYTANAFKDTSGNHVTAVTSSTAWNFTTGDFTAPTLSSVSPADNATDVAITANLVLTFDGITRAGTGTLTIKKTSDDSTVETITVSGALLSGNGSTDLTLDPSTTLTNSTAYYIVYSANAFKDTSGNHTTAVTASTTWNFTTVAAAASSSSSAESTETSTSTGGGGGGGGSRGSPSLFALRVAAAQERILGGYTHTLASAQSSSSPASRKRKKKKTQDIVLAPTFTQKRGRLLAVIDAKEVVYRDVPVDSWFAPYISLLITDDIAQGYKDPQGNLTGEFGVSNPVTRAEVLKMALFASEDPDLTRPMPPPRNFSALPTWAAGYVALAEQKQLSIFTPTLNVHAPATRGEVIQTILETLGITVGNTPASYPDVPASHPYSRAIAAASFFGLVQGYKDGTFRPDEPINRAEVSKLIALARELRKK